MQVSSALFVLIAAVFSGVVCHAETTIEELAEKDYAQPVRPIGVGGQANWNKRAIWFMYPPTFGFTNSASAAKYRFVTEDEGNVVRTFEAQSANASLAPVWRDLPVGWTELTCLAIAADGRELGRVGKRTFWRQAPYRPGTYPKPKRSYAEASKLITRYVMNLPIVKQLYLNKGPVPAAMVKPGIHVFVAYPSKMGAAIIEAMAAQANADPESCEEAIRLAMGSARRLFEITEPEGTALAGFPRTYESHPGLTGHPAKIVEDNKGKIMMIYPCEVADAYLSLYEVTKDEALRSAALKIADRYLALQGEDGTWALNCWRSDGRAVEANRMLPVKMIEFLERVYALTGERKYRNAADAAFAYVEKGPLTTWNWEGQFEDVAPSGMYVNLTKHDACDFAKHLIRRFPGDARRLAQARELLRFSEDQFVCWERPCHGVSDDPRSKGVLDGCGSWRCPAVLEQYMCYLPIDASAAKLVDTYLALYAAEKNPLDLAKARTLGDSIVRETHDDGRCPTFWFDFVEDWPNCMVASALALKHLAEVREARESLFFVGAHPDDSEGFAATAFLLRDAYDIHVIDLTRGELGLGKKGLEDGTTAKRRVAEEQAACAYLGATPHFLAEVDGSACAGRQSVEMLAKLIDELKPRAVFTHWPVDRHVDHIQTAAVTMNAIRFSKHKPERYFFEVEFGQTKNFYPTYSIDVTSTISNKIEMLKHYVCQGGENGLWKNNYARAKQHGEECGFAFAELFSTYDGKPVKGGVLEPLKKVVWERPALIPNRSH